MNPFEMVVLIVAIVMIAKVMRDRALRPPAPEIPAETEALLAEVARLRDRVEVLERLATDKSRRLADEIDSLRS